MEKYYILSTKYAIRERNTKRNGKTFDVRFHVITMDGEYKEKQLCGYSSKTLAKQGFADFIAKHCIPANQNPIERKNTKIEPTVKEMIQKYIVTLGNQNKESSIYDKIKIYDQWIIPSLGDKKMKDLTIDYLYQWQDNLWNSKNPRTGKYYSYKYLEKIRTHLGSFLSWSAKRYNTSNNLRLLDKPRKTTAPTEKEIWTRKEFDDFINHVDDPMYHCLFTMMFFTGRRKGEIFALTPDDITEKGIRWNKTVTRKTLDGTPWKVTSTKQSSSQIQPIAAPLAAELEKYKGQSPFFFGGARPLAENTVTRKLDHYIAISGQKRLKNHEMRHSYVSMLIHLGANYKLVAELIGDTPEQVIRTYGHEWNQDKIAIVNSIK